jgi:starch-binding outer membrane protein, SusD/RagB family
MKANIYFIIIFSIGLFFSSCEDYLEKVPLDEPTDVTFWSTEAELKMAVNSLYNSLYWTDRAVTHLPFQMLLSIASDESWDRNLSCWQLLGNGLITPSEETLIYGAWRSAYSNIGKSNRLLTYMDRAEENTNPQLYKRIEAEAKFFRAYWYYLLINFYGDVPFTTEPIDIFDAELSRTDKTTIYSFILSELDAAAEILPISYSGNDYGRVTKGAALSLKARVALLNNDWSVAATTAKRVIDLSVYSLFPDYEKLFTYEGENNNEEIFTIQFSREYGLIHQTPVHTRGRLGGGFVTKIPTQVTIDSYECIDGLSIDKSPLYDPTNPFENRDPRLHATCVVPGSIFLGFQFETHPDSLRVWDYNTDPPRRVNNLEVTHAYATFSGYQYRKYVADEEREFRQESELNYMIIRFAEVLLTFAEAKIELGELDADVYSAINMVRLRAGMPEIATGKSQNELRKIVRQERKVEFVFEGLRFFDIRRWRIAEFVMPGKTYGRPLHNFKSYYIPVFDENGTPHHDAYADELRMFNTRYFNPGRDYLWPIPQKELDINPNLTQNPGY